MGKNAVINKCIKVETAGASIYRNFMRLFPEEKNLWEKMYNDEKEHISFLNDVKSLRLKDLLHEADLLPSMDIINKTLESSEIAKKKVKEGSITFRTALKMALKLEESMVEVYTNRIIAKLISCDNGEGYKKTVADEKRHINRIKKRIRSK